jgi:hypothetical protein
LATAHCTHEPARNLPDDVEDPLDVEVLELVPVAVDVLVGVADDVPDEEAVPDAEPAKQGCGVRTWSDARTAATLEGQQNPYLCKNLSPLQSKFRWTNWCPLKCLRTLPSLAHVRESGMGGGGCGWAGVRRQFRVWTRAGGPQLTTASAGPTARCSGTGGRRLGTGGCPAGRGRAGA